MTAPSEGFSWPSGLTQFRIEGQMATKDTIFRVSTVFQLILEIYYQKLYRNDYAHLKYPYSNGTKIEKLFCHFYMASINNLPYQGCSVPSRPRKGLRKRSLLILMSRSQFWERIPALAPRHCTLPGLATPARLRRLWRTVTYPISSSATVYMWALKCLKITRNEILLPSIQLI